MGFFRTLVAAGACAAIATPALAAGKIYYGSRAGMTVTVVSMSGIDGPNAVINTRHTRQDATAFCRDYIGKVSKTCVDDEMQARLSDQIKGDCTTGRFTDFGGVEHQFLGKARGNETEGMMAKFVIKDVADGRIADGSSASGYGTNMSIFRALCPAKAPPARDE